MGANKPIPYSPPPTAALMRSGVYFDLANPRARDIKIEDIAYGLARIVRFAGQGKGFYSVAEHSVHVSHIVSDECALEALLHDAHEAYIGDVISPVKCVSPDFMRLDRVISELVRCVFGVAACMSSQTEMADKRMLVLEQRVVMENSDLWLNCYDLDVPAIEIGFWPPEVAEQRFLERFWKLIEKEAP